MHRSMLLLLLCGALLFPVYDPAVSAKLQNGELLRMHVIAEDNSALMQAMKKPVRDAVQSVYAASSKDGKTMLDNAEELLPLLTSAAQAAARQAGYMGQVSLMLGRATFDARTLDGIYIPAGDYPALVIRMGAGLGKNWWGLIDPRCSLLAASAGHAEGILWDWSPDALWQTILHTLAIWRGGQAV